MNQARHRSLLAACALMLGLPGAAKAQYVFDDAILPPRVVAWRLADRGFSGIGRPRFDGRAYVVEAFAPNGTRVRLFVDAADGAILGRQRLDPPALALARPLPGYGWTEEDAEPRPLRQAERLVPPGDIPMPESRGVPPRRGYAPGRPEGVFGAPNRAAIEPNPNGVNPDARPRQDAPRKLARVGAPPLRHSEPKSSEPKSSEPKAARIVPDAPQPKVPEAAKGETKPEAEAPAAAVESPKPASAIPATPAAVQPPSEGAVAVKPAEAVSAKSSEANSSEAKSSETKSSEAKSVEQAWKDPPEGRRPVRVIGGATMVPGQPEAKPDAAQ